MSSEFNRRNFLKTIGAAGLGSVLASKAKADSNEPNAAGQKLRAKDFIVHVIVVDQKLRGILAGDIRLVAFVRVKCKEQRAK